MNPKKILLTAALAISVVFISMLILEDEATAKADAKTGKMTVPVIKSITPGEGKKAPDFTWEEDGKEMRFSKVTKGKVAFVNFWATWCGPCRHEIPDIIKLNRDLQAKGSDVVFIGIGVFERNDGTNKLEQYINSANFNYPVYHDASNNGKLYQAFGGGNSIPGTFIINRKGEIVEKIVGMKSYEDFANSIKMAMLK